MTGQEQVTVGRREIIGYEGPPPEAHRRNMEATLNRPLNSRKVKGATHRQFLEHWRTKRGPREVHSDGFLAVANPAVMCSCGGCCIHADAYRCPRCGKQANP